MKESQLKLKHALQILMALHHDNDADTRGLVEIENNGAVKITFDAKSNDCIPDIAAVVDALNKGKMLRDPDAAALNVHAKRWARRPIQLAQNATIDADPLGQTVLNFLPCAPSEKVTAVIEQGIQATLAAFATQDEKRVESRNAQIGEAFAESAGPVISARTDITLVENYLKAKIRKAIPLSNPTVEYREEGYVLPRQEFTVNLGTPRGQAHVARYLDFVDGEMKRVFAGEDAVIRSPMPDDRELTFYVYGNPARLIGDIKRNDPHNLPKSIMAMAA